MVTKFIKSQSGFSIVQGLMLAAAVAGMALIGTKLMTDQKMAEKSADSKDKIEQLHKMIYSILQNKDHCNATFGTMLTADPTLLNSGLSRPVASVNSTGGSAFQVNSSGVYNPQLMYMNNSVSINDMNIVFPTNLNNNYATLSITYGRMEKNDMSKRSGSGYGSQTVRKNISIKLQREFGTFEGCYATQGSNQDSVKEFCDSFALLTWDANQNICRYKDLKCNPGELFAGFDSTGAKKCHKVEEWMDMSNLVDPSPVSCIGATSVGLVQVGNKVRIDCSGACTPVNGGWGPWVNTGPCVLGSRPQSRVCNNPAPSCGGSPCVGPTTQTTAVGCGGCFVAGTQIEMSDGTQKNIEEILLGDKLRDTENKTVEVKKLLVMDYWGDVFSINGGPYFFTPNHPFLTLDGWKSLAPEASMKESPGLKVGLLKKGDILLKKTGIELVLTLDSKITEEKIYNFQLNGTHSYIADEYKVHNKCMSPSCPPGESWRSCDGTNCTGSCLPTADPYCF